MMAQKISRNIFDRTHRPESDIHFLPNLRPETKQA